MILSIKMSLCKIISKSSFKLITRINNTTSAFFNGYFLLMLEIEEFMSM